ncbi:hypothetical protein [Streptosporangium sp. KLBMP 9127]|nr:hypothetical protein [Streptosporangium sp. KLBMP 9127]
MTEILAVCGALVVLAGGTVVAVKILRGMKRFGDFVDDWQGEPARRGVPARLGVMERLERIEAQLKPNGGTSLRDAVNRVEKTTARLDEHLTPQED